MFLSDNIESNNVSPDSIVELKKFIELVDNLEIQTLLNKDDDNAILTIHPGAGGKTQDWAFMLYRMYIKWAELHKLNYNLLSYTEGMKQELKMLVLKLR